MLRRFVRWLKGPPGGRSDPDRSVLPADLAPLAANHRRLDDAGLEKIRRSLRRHYFGADPGWLDTDPGKRDLEIHLHARLDALRGSTVPWLNQARPLHGASVLEIGCGTGSGTVALAEQGADLVAVDLDEKSLRVAEERCGVYGLEVRLVRANAVDVQDLFGGRRFDVILFSAALEHMTHEERILAMRRTWEMLPEGGLWCVTETPNRLWYFDHHTSQLPFFLWLPDDLAYRYSRFSPRAGYRERYGEVPGDENRLHFLRRGRGVSFHEFEIAWRPAGELRVVSSREEFLRARWSRSRRAEYETSTEHAYRSLLAKIGPPGIHPGFYERDLDLVLRKD